MQPKILLVDDEPNVTSGLRRALRRQPYEILTAASGAEALEILKDGNVDLVISDEQMPGMTGSELLATVRRRHPETMRVILTGQAKLDAAVKAINEGEVFRFLLKPCNEYDLAATIRQALQHKQLITESQRLLRAARRQSELLHELEVRAPGITDVRMDEDGAILIEDPVADVDELIRLLAEQAGRSEQAGGITSE